MREPLSNLCRGRPGGHAVEQAGIERQTLRYRERLLQETQKGKWLPGKDSNPDSQDQNLLCYHYTTGQQ